MIAYFIVGIFVIFFSFFSSYSKKDKYGLFSSFICIFLFLALRYDYGNDYHVYYLLFQKINTNFSDYMNGSKGFEPGWVLINRIFKPFGFYSLVFFLAFINCVVYYHFVKKFVARKYYWFAVLIYYFNAYFLLIQLSAMRQCLAILLFVFSLDYIINRKYVKSALLILLAISFHYSALFLVPIILITLFFDFKLKFIHIIIIEIVYVLLFTLGGTFKPLLLSISTYLFGSKYSFYISMGSSPGIINIIVYSVLLLGILIYYKNFSSDYQLLSRLFIVGLILLPVGFILPISSRMSLYFLPVSIVLYPKFLELTDTLVIRQIFIISVILVFSMRLFTFLSANWLHYSHYSTIISTLFTK